MAEVWFLGSVLINHEGHKGARTKPSTVRRTCERRQVDRVIPWCRCREFVKAGWWYHRWKPGNFGSGSV